MTKTQIKAELRREAMQPNPMFCYLKAEAEDVASDYLPEKRKIFYWDNEGNIKRTFFLLVAEAL